MNTAAIEQDFRQKVCAQIRLEKEGVDRYRVFTPFIFDDGDHYAIMLRSAANQWFLTDEGHTFMHMTYDIDEKDWKTGTRSRIVNNTLSAFSIQNRSGELVSVVQNGEFGDSLYSFLQGLLKITDISYLSRERVVSTFMEDLHGFLKEFIPSSELNFNWRDPKNDQSGKYLVDVMIPTPTDPIYLFGLQNDDKTRDTTISIHQYEKWGTSCRTVAVFEDQEGINRKVLARFSDVCDRQFPSLKTDPQRIKKHLSHLMAS
jgi:hypothetical protein